MMLLHQEAFCCVLRNSVAQHLQHAWQPLSAQNPNMSQPPTSSMLIMNSVGSSWLMVVNETMSLNRMVTCKEYCKRSACGMNSQ